MHRGVVLLRAGTVRNKHTNKNLLKWLIHYLGEIIVNKKSRTPRGIWKSPEKRKRKQTEYIAGSYNQNYFCERLVNGRE